MRDSIIQRFEYSIDGFWKLLKEYLEIYYGLEPAASPKIILKQFSDMKLITLEEYQIFIKMINDRNLTSHEYNKQLAEQISKSVPEYYELMKLISKKLKIKKRDKLLI